jgi:hypothetical protein
LVLLLPVIFNFIGFLLDNNAVLLGHNDVFRVLGNLVNPLFFQFTTKPQTNNDFEASGATQKKGPLGQV